MTMGNNAQSYLMLRRPRQAYWISQKEIDYNNNLEAKEASNEEFLDNHFSMPSLD
jgi:hypothetical protein